MESADSTHILYAAKTWISAQTGIDSSNLHVFQYEKRGSDFEVGVEGNAGNSLKRFIVTVNTSGTVIGHREAYTPGRKGGESTLIIVAFVFSILSVIGSGIYFFVILGVAFVPSVIAPAILFIMLIPLVFFSVGIYCLYRINRIRNFYSAGRYREAYEENTLGLGVLALLFNGIVTGILLLVARPSMQEEASS